MKKFKTTFTRRLIPAKAGTAVTMLIILLLLISAAFILSCCTRKKEAVTLKIWTALEQKELETLKQICADFSKQKNIPVIVTQIPMADLQLKYQVAVPAGFGPDLITAPHDNVGSFSLAKLISSLSEKEFTPELRKKFNPVALKAVTFNGNVYGMPFSLEAIAIIYNKALVSREPQTMEELVDTAKKLTVGDQYGFLVQTDDQGNFYFCWPFFSGFGTYIFKNNKGTLDIKDIGLDKQPSVDALNYLKYLHESKIMPLSVRTDTSREFFNKGKAAFIINGPWSLSEIRKNKINYGVMPFPKLKNGRVPGPFVGVWALMLNPESKNRALALEFMKYFNTPENQMKIYRASGRIPSRVENYDEVKQNKDSRGFLASINNGTPAPNHPAMNPVWDHMSRTIIVVTDGKQPAAQALEYIVKIIKEDIKSMLE